MAAVLLLPVATQSTRAFSSAGLNRLNQIQGPGSEKRRDGRRSDTTTFLPAVRALTEY